MTSIILGRERPLVAMAQNPFLEACLAAFKSTSEENHLVASAELCKHYNILKKASCLTKSVQLQTSWAKHA